MGKVKRKLHPASLALVTAVIALAALAAGCGGSGTTTKSQATTTGAEAASAARGAEGSGKSKATKPTEGSGSSQGSPSSSQPSGGDHSIQEYGSHAAGGKQRAITATAKAFFAAMARSDYAAVCNGLAAPNRKQLEAFLKATHRQGGCPTVLATLLSSAAGAEAQKAAQGAFTGVRVKGDIAFVLFRPKGGRPSYFTLKREGSSWKSISVSSATLLNPAAGLP